jgi:Cadherin-like
VSWHDVPQPNPRRNPQPKASPPLPPPRHWGRCPPGSPQWPPSGGLTLNEGATGAITATLLDFDDAEQADSAILYTVTSAATNGTLFRTGVALGVGGAFTQADIGSNLITDAHVLQFPALTDGGQPAFLAEFDMDREADFELSSFL